MVGARPQFVKAAPVSRALRAAGASEVLLHTGQHYDHGMSQSFFDELGLPPPAVHLGVGSGKPGWQVARMLEGIEAAIAEHAPEVVLVYGDTNSTLAGALAANKSGVRLAHVEAGLRSFNRGMPEEHNRVLTDHCSDLLLCPTQRAVDNLAAEGITAGVHKVGDPMYDVVKARGADAEAARAELGLEGPFALATLHRPSNVDDHARLARWAEALGGLDVPVVLPVHPRAKAGFAAAQIPPRLRLTGPLPHGVMMGLVAASEVVLTDSGGLQKEAFFLSTPCVTLRHETEWVELIECGWNVLAKEPADLEAGLAAVRDLPPRPADLYGDGRAAEAIAERVCATR